MLSFATLRWIFLQNLVNAITYVKRSPYVSAENQPDEIKTYAGFQHLFASRIFRPAKPTTSRLPLVIRVHGGGFVMNSPAADDALARFIADNAHCVVVSVDYSKAPLRPFPAAYEDLVGLTSALVADAALHVDPSKVVVYGTSSGGNLALAIAQDPRVRSRLLGVIAFSPPVDLATPFAEKMASRPDPSVPDFLESMYQSIVNIYLGDSNVSLEDPRISPNRFGRREDLPDHLYLISVEHDLLARETEAMAETLAQKSEREKTAKGWQAAGVKWDLIRGQTHAFENWPVKEAAREELRLAVVDSANRDIIEWLRKVFE